MKFNFYGVQLLNIDKINGSALKRLIILTSFLYAIIIISSLFLPKRVLYAQLGEAKLYGKNSEG